MIAAIHHVQITIPEGTEQQARGFYCEFLGLSEVQKPPSLIGRGGFWIQVGDQQVHIGTEPPFDRPKTKAHIAYLVTDLDGWRAKFTAHHLEILTGIPIPGFDRFEFRDPFGNRVEFIQNTAERDAAAHP